MSPEFYSPPFPRRVSSPGQGVLFALSPVDNGATRRTTSPGAAYAARRRSSSHARRSSLETMMEVDTQIQASKRHSSAMAPTNTARTQSKPNLSKQRTPSLSKLPQQAPAAAQLDFVLRSESILIAEVKTNVVVTNEYLFITELSYHLSIRYQRPIGSVVVNLQHGACLFFGGSFDPAYILTVSGVAEQTARYPNKKNIGLLQVHMEQALRVPAMRGVVRFMPIAEECLGCGGRTLAEAAPRNGIDQQQQHQDHKNPEYRKAQAYAARNQTTSLTSVRQTPRSAKDRPRPSTQSSADGGLVSRKPPKDSATSPDEAATAKKKKSFIKGLFHKG